MSKEKRRVPKLRFPGFTEDWEQRKLGQFTARVTRKNGGQSDLPLTISAQDGLVDQRKYFNRQVASRDMSNYYLIKKGEFAYNKSYSEGYPFGAVKRLDYYDIGALSTLYILFEITDKNISSDFIVSYYMTHLWYKEISKRAAEGARNHGLLNISTEDFFDSELNIPNSIEEQVKIGNFIKEFDKFITLHQRKLDNLKLKKKALLQKLFPKNGERYPELRFPGFTDAWEQRKLSDVLVERNEQQVETREYPLMSFVQGLGVTPKGERYDRSFLVLDQSKKYKRTELGDFIYSSNNLETGSIGINKTGKAVISPVYSIFQGVSIGDSQFIGIMSLLPRFIAKMIRFRQGVVYGQWRIHETDFLDISVLIPSVDERTKITQLIFSIEKLITLHQRKLDHLQLQKKALLQQMFV